MNIALDAKVLIEGMNPPYRVLGDSGYPISKCLITPYSTDEAEVDPTKRLFNLRHCGMRAEATECIFGRLKEKWPILKVYIKQINIC